MHPHGSVALCQPHDKAMSFYRSVFQHRRFHHSCGPYPEITDKWIVPGFLFVTLRSLTSLKTSVLYVGSAEPCDCYTESIALGRRFLTLSIVKRVLDKRLLSISYSWVGWQESNLSRHRHFILAIPGVPEKDYVPLL